MAMFSEERTPSRSFGCWVLVSMVETQGGFEKVVQRAGCEEESASNRDGRPSRYRTPRAIGPIW